MFTLRAGLVLCVSGVYAVISFTTSQRTKEIGVRMALGARHADIRRLVLTEGALVVGSGALAGAAAALLTGRLLRTLLFEVTPWDPLTLGSVVAVVVGAGLLACYLPAARAAGVDPVSALRD